MTDEERQVRDQARAAAGLSLLIPGLAQFVQRRWLPAITHLGAVSTQLIMVAQLGWGRAGWAAVAWNIWSACEAYWHVHEHGEPISAHDGLQPPKPPSSLP